MTVREFALVCLGLQVFCLLAGIGLQALIQAGPGSTAYSWLLLLMAGPSVLVLGLFFTGAFLGVVNFLAAWLEGFFTPCRPRR